MKTNFLTQLTCDLVRQRPNREMDHFENLRSDCRELMCSVEFTLTDEGEIITNLHRCPNVARTSRQKVMVNKLTICNLCQCSNLFQIAMNQIICPEEFKINHVLMHYYDSDKGNQRRICIQCKRENTGVDVSVCRPLGE